MAAKNKHVVVCRFRLFLWLAMISLMSSCYYYKVTTSDEDPETAIPKLEEEGKFFILHCETQVWSINNIRYDAQSVSGELSFLKGHEAYLKTNPASTHNRYKRTTMMNSQGKYVNTSEVLREVHLYATHYVRDTSTRVTIPVSAIFRVEIYDPAKTETALSWIFGSLGVTAGIVLAAVIISTPASSYAPGSSSSSSGSSCPFISTFDGSGYAFSGEIFTGAIRQNLERDDYLPLSGREIRNGEYRIKISNELHEIQHINQAALVVVDHPENVTVLFDKYGTLHGYSQPIAPVEACNGNGNSVASLINEKDSLSYAYDTQEQVKNEIESLVLKFPCPDNADSAKLLIRARNTFWLELLFAKYHALFGGKYDAFTLKQDRVPPDVQVEWALSQHIPLMVSVEKNGEWVYLDYFNVAGPMAFKDDLLTISLDDIDSDTVKIKLEYGFLFWEIDYAAIDFSSAQPLRVSYVPIQQAIDEKGKDLTRLMRDKDSDYYVQDVIGNEASLTFKMPSPSVQQRSVLLHTSGYYNILRKQQGKPRRSILRSFRNPGRMPAYSLELYDQVRAACN